MPIVNRIAEFQADMTAWRRQIHAHPETAFEEKQTADLVADRLKSFGIEIHRGMAKTGVVGVLKSGTSRRAIGLRADMDALNMHELNGFAHASKHKGKMHACGHDGHTTMLLGAAKYLAETRNFDGTVYFIFQPAEEGEGGARVMLEEGLFEKFPVEAVFGMHNWPGMPPGTMGIKTGAMLAGADRFNIKIMGKGTHGALPHLGRDPVLVAAEIVLALQGIVSRNVEAQDAAIVSVTIFNAGDAFNVIPDHVTLGGTTRFFRSEVQDMIEARMRQIVDGICAAHGCAAEINYERCFPPLINTAAETQLAGKVAASVVGERHLVVDPAPMMGSEDFAFMLQKKPGSYVWIGNGDGPERGGGCMLHNPHYDFNDEILAVGASYWARLAETALAK
jgi:hippurate hydrolase